MTLRRCAALVALLAFAACKPSKPTVEQLTGALRQTVESTKSYRARIEASTKPNPMARPKPDAKVASTAELAAVLPDKLRMTAHSTSPGPMETRLDLDGKVVLDGTTAWIEMHMTGAPSGPVDNVLKLDQKKLAPPEKPYQIGFSVNGIGLRGGEDLIGSLRGYLDDYALEAKVADAKFAGEPAWRVDGKLELEKLVRQLPHSDPAFFGSYASMLQPGPMQEKQREAALASMNRAALASVEGTLKLSLYFSKEKGHRLLGWEQGSTKETITRVVLASFEPGAAVPAETFVPAKEVVEGARDNTPNLLALRAKADEVLADEALVEKAIAHMKAAIEDGLAAAAAKP